MKIMRHFSLKNFLTAIAFTLFGITTSTAHAATVDLFLKIDGIRGESLDNGHVGWIGIDSFSWGVNHHAGSSGGLDKASFSPFAWTQWLDSSVPPLFTGVASGKLYKSAILDVERIFSAQGPFFTMQFDNVHVTDLNINGTTSSQTVAVAAALDYSKITMTYRPTTRFGPFGPGIIGGWDLTGGNPPAFFGSPAVLEGLFLAQAAASPVPVPAAVWLFGSGLLGLIGVARRKSA